MANVDVLFKRNWRTPLGRFMKSDNGVPTPVPQSVLDRYELPSDAEICGEDYQTPEEVNEEEALRDHDATHASAMNEAEINRRVNEELEKREAKAAKDKAEDTAARAAAAAAEDGPVVDPSPDNATSDVKDEGDGDGSGESEGEVPTEAEAEKNAEDGGEGEATGGEVEGQAALLEASVKDVTEALADMEFEELQSLMKLEEAGQNRKTLLAEIKVALEDFEDDDE